MSMIRKLTEKYDVVETIPGRSDGMGGFLAPRQQKLDTLLGLTSPHESEVEGGQYITTTETFEILTQYKLPTDWFDRRIIFQQNETRYKIKTLRKVARRNLSVIVVEVIRD